MTELSYITSYTDEHGYPPTLSEIAEQFGYSTTTAWRKMQKLIEQGLVEQAPGMPRTLVVKTVMKVEGWTL